MAMSFNLTNPYQQFNPYGLSLARPDSGSTPQTFSNPVQVSSQYSNPLPDKYTQTNVGTATQTPTNVLDVRPQLQSLLSQYQNLASGVSGLSPNFTPIKLNTNFAGPGAYQQGLQNGIDYFGRLGISEGIQAINAQRDAANRQLADVLGRSVGNEGLLNVLQNQNLFRSNLATNPLYSDAQKGTAQRIQDQINLQNALVKAQNDATLSQGTYNQQGQLAALQAKLALLQPTQNLLDILTNLQGQARGLTGTDTQFGGKNFT